QEVEGQRNPHGEGVERESSEEEAHGWVSYARSKMRRRTTPSGRPPPAWRVRLVVLLPGFPARADLGEREQVVGERRDDRVPEVVLRRVEAVEVPRAVGRPPRADEQGHDRKL